MCMQLEVSDRLNQKEFTDFLTVALHRKKSSSLTLFSVKMHLLPKDWKLTFSIKRN